MKQVYGIFKPKLFSRIIQGDPYKNYSEYLNV